MIDSEVRGTRIPELGLEQLLEIEIAYPIRQMKCLACHLNFFTGIEAGSPAVMKGRVKIWCRNVLGRFSWCVRGKFAQVAME